MTSGKEDDFLEADSYRQPIDDLGKYLYRALDRFDPQDAAYCVLPKRMLLSQ